MFHLLFIIGARLSRVAERARVPAQHPISYCCPRFEGIRPALLINHRAIYPDLKKEATRNGIVRNPWLSLYAWISVAAREPFRVSAFIFRRVLAGSAQAFLIRSAIIRAAVVR